MKNYGLHARVFIVNFEQISDIADVSVVDFEQVSTVILHHIFFLFFAHCTF